MIDDQLYNVLNESMVDGTSVFDEKMYEDVTNRLKNVRLKNKANIDISWRVHVVKKSSKLRRKSISTPETPTPGRYSTGQWLLSLKMEPIRYTSVQYVKTTRCCREVHSYSVVVKRTFSSTQKSLQYSKGQKSLSNSAGS